MKRYTMSDIRCTNKGFTYLEILATLIILTVAVVPMLLIMPGAMEVATNVDRHTRSSILAQWKMDEVRSRALGTNALYGFTVDYDESATAFPSPDGSYKYTITDDDGTNIKEVNVTVWFDEDGNSTRDSDEEYVSLDTKIANRGTWQT